MVARVRLSLESHAHGGQKEVMRDFRPGQLITSPIGLAAVPATTVVANVFDGGPKTVVTMSVGVGAPVTMVRVPRPDPFVNDVFARNEAVKKPWIKAEVSSHVWTARLPPGLPAGTHCLIVTAVTEYGGKVGGHAALEIIG